MDKIIKLIVITSFIWLGLGQFTVAQGVEQTMVLSDDVIRAKINELPNWEVKDNSLIRTFKFKDFIEAISFVNRLVEPAEKAGHHPDISISYNTVVIKLTTHDAGGITQKDFDLAKTISNLAS